MTENKWLTGVITLLIGVVTPIYNWFLGPPCNSLIPLKYGDSRRNPFDIQTVEGRVYKSPQKMPEKFTTKMCLKPRPPQMVKGEFPHWNARNNSGYEWL